MSHVPPKAHLRKAQDRLGRLEEMATIEVLRPTKGERFRLPPKRVRREYLELHDLVLRDYGRILDDLLEEDEPDDTGEG